MLTLPVLDDKRFRQIYDEAVARIPTLTREWTDFNPQDTGILLLELLAAMTEQQNFYLDRMGDRFYEKYLELVTEPVAGETTDQRKRRFARESAQSGVAVTLEDYERLALRSPFAIGWAAARFEDGFIRLTVLRGSGPLDDGELAGLRGWLEPYRLLTARLKVVQAVCVPVDVVCRVTMDGALERESVCRKKLEALFLRFTEKQRLGQPPELDRLRVEILSMREIVRVDRLYIRESGNVPGGGAPGELFTWVRGVEITVARGEKQGEGREGL